MRRVCLRRLAATLCAPINPALINTSDAKSAQGGDGHDPTETPASSMSTCHMMRSDIS
jgi:hypothetical protein